MSGKRAVYPPLLESGGDLEKVFEDLGPILAVLGVWLLRFESPWKTSQIHLVNIQKSQRPAEIFQLPMFHSVELLRK